MKKLSKLFLSGLVAGLLAVSGCTSGTTSNPKAEPDVKLSATPKDGDTVSSGDAVDPQVLSDVAVGVFMAPGASMRRMMRVDNFITDFMFMACGSTEKLSIDRTVERHDQDIFPDLDLIRTKGFREMNPRITQKGNLPPPPGFKPGCDSASEGNIEEKLPSHQSWMNLYEPWEDILKTVEQDPSVVELKATFAQCLRDGTKGTGIMISSDDPARTFIRQTDKALGNGSLDPREVEQRFPKLYTTCGENYFGRMQGLLEAERPAMIERHRELLEQFAREIVAIGYVP